MDILGRVHEVPTSFEVLTNFEVHKFDELTSLVCPTIRDNAHSTCIERIMSGEPHEVDT